MVVFEKYIRGNLSILDSWDKGSYFQKRAIHMGKDDFGAFQYYYLPKSSGGNLELSFTHPSKTGSAACWAEAFEDPS